MSSGKKIRYNTRERVISPDLNRAQAFSIATLSDVLQHLFHGLLINPDYGGGTVLTTVTSVGTPLAGVVLGGLMVVVPTSSTQLIVTEGMVALLDPDGATGSPIADPANPDDSHVKLISDAGVAGDSGTLVLTPNASGSVRVDVIEVQRLPNVVEESDNRDIFDKTTGLFTPTTVDKVMAHRLNYRIRTGTPGAGVPANAQGWMPLAVAVVANGATTWDDAIFYDVRPLAREREPYPSLFETSSPKRRANYMTDFSTALGERRVSGVIERQRAGWKVGGVLTSNVGGSDVSYLDIGATGTYHEPGIVITANNLAYVWALFPNGLPRWVRYTTIAISPYGGRIPNGMRGIPVVTHKGPLDMWGLTPSAAIGLPAGGGFDAGSTSNACLLFAPVFDSAGANVSAVLEDDRAMHFAFGTSPASLTWSKAVATAATSATEDFFNLTATVDFPLSAKTLWLLCQATFTGVAATEFEYYENIDLLLSTGTTQFLAQSKYSNRRRATMPAGGTMTVTFSQEVPTPQNYPISVGTAARYRVNWSPSAGATKAAGSIMGIGGWRL